MKSLGQIAVVVLIAVAIFSLRSCDRQQTSDDVAEQAMAVVQSLPDYGKHQQFYDDAFVTFHDHAFNVNYSQRRRSSSFDERSYKIVLFGEIMTAAKNAGNNQVFETMKQELLKIQP